MLGVVEEAVNLGIDQSTSAMVSLPTKIDPAKPALIFFNAGILHRVGPFRLHVRLTRALAGEGFVAARMDVSGLGYSAKDPARSGFESAHHDARALMQYLREEYDCQSFIVGGICSGADNAYKMSVVERSIVGGIFVDGYAYENPKSRYHHYRRRVFRLQIWSDWFRSKFNKPPQEDQLKTPEVADIWEFDDPPEAQFRAELKQLCSRDFKGHFIYSGVVPGYSYAEQFHDTFPESKGAMDVTYFADADHTFILEQDRQPLIDSILHWCQRQFA